MAIYLDSKLINQNSLTVCLHNLPYEAEALAFVYMWITDDDSYFDEYMEEPVIGTQNYVEHRFEGLSPDTHYNVYCNYWILGSHHLETTARTHYRDVEFEPNYPFVRLIAPGDLENDNGTLAVLASCTEFTVRERMYEYKVATLKVPYASRLESPFEDTIEDDAFSQYVAYWSKADLWGSTLQLMDIVSLERGIESTGEKYEQLELEHVISRLKKYTLTDGNIMGELDGVMGVLLEGTEFTWMDSAIPTFAITLDYIGVTKTKYQLLQDAMGFIAAAYPAQFFQMFYDGFEITLSSVTNFYGTPTVVEAGKNLKGFTKTVDITTTPYSTNYTIEVIEIRDSQEGLSMHIGSYDRQPINYGTLELFCPGALINLRDVDSGMVTRQMCVYVENTPIRYKNTKIELCNPVLDIIDTIIEQGE
jgi:hypothetical protein